jgi:hypothetical protein
MPAMNARAEPIPRGRTRFGSFIAGLGALASIWPAGGPPPYPHRSDAEALREDTVRIGGDMRRVIDREHAQIEEKPK